MKLIIASLNIGCGISSEITNLSDLKTYFASLINDNNIDILLLQEVPGSDRPNLISCKIISEITHLKYYEECMLSKSHLVDNANMGISIMSRFPLELEDIYMLPKLNFNTIKDGQTISPHEKGFISCKINHETKRSVRIINGHCPSFSYFNKNPFNYIKTIYEPLENVLCKYNNPAMLVIIGGDFNTIELENMMPRLFEQFKSPINEPTRLNNDQNDYILVQQNTNVVQTSVKRTIFDHHICIIEISDRGEDNNEN